MMKIHIYKFLGILLALIAGSSLMANNIAISNLSLTGKNTTDHFSLVQFNISWENSWRTTSPPNNWDAAWVFVKYRKAGGVWQHAWLNESGHTASTGSIITPGLLNPGDAFNATTNPGLGVFIYRSDDGTGTFTNNGVQLRWNYGANGLTDADVAEIAVFAIEMVYVPQGAYYVGSGGTESGSFTNGSWSGGPTVPLLISSENELTIAQTAGNLWGTSASPDKTIGGAGTLPAVFPKGYDAFYCMKYEISQQQYVDFLNSITSTQAANRYSSGSTGFRYGITVSSGVYSTTNPFVPCNFLCWMDGAAYTDWAGLRPMTELEFEKACRGTSTPVAGEHAWGNTTATTAHNITNRGAINETTNTPGANAIFYDLITGQEGPMRTGVFATGSTTRVQAGGTYYGIMEMSGNLWERVVTVGSATGRAFSGVHGNGTMSTAGNADISTWPGFGTAEVTGATGSGFRGGSFLDNYMNVSNRELGSLDYSDRFNNDGFRAVRTQPLPKLTTKAATIILTTTASSGGNVTSDGGGTITARGICWSTTTGPTTALTTKTTEDGTIGEFTGNLTGLTASTLYYVRAYATNSAGTAYGNEVSFTTAAPFVCGTSSLSINHVTTDGVAPVDKTVTYGTVTNIPGETGKCWITSNLGADHQATSESDNTEPSAGWYWQFNRMQGYKHDGTTRTPATAWITSINEDVNWAIANDPCNLELGSSWRIPTYTEWNNVNSIGGWTNWGVPWNSGLKLHASGYLTAFNGSSDNRGFFGLYWSSTQSNILKGQGLYFSSGSGGMFDYSKENAFTLRCLKDLLPTLTTTNASGITATTATSGGNITDQGGSTVTARGVCWSTSANPTTALLTKTTDGTNSGIFTSAINGLAAGTLYHIRAYATNTEGTSYGEDKSFTTEWACGSSLVIDHVTTGGVAPVDKTVSYGTVSTTFFGGTKCTITQNLGSTNQAGAATDATEASAGWYWQFNRKQGYKADCENDNICFIPSSPAWNIINDLSSSWESAKDPCTLELGDGWRIPTRTEWTVADTYWDNYNHAYASELKLHAAGYLEYNEGKLVSRGSAGLYWSSTVYGGYSAYHLWIASSTSQINNAGGKVNAFTIRCIKD